MTGKKVAKAKKKPKLVTPSHGRGKIYEGGVPGNKGGTGRPPSELRDAMREILDGNLEKLEQLINDPDVRPGDKIRAFEVLAHFSIGTSDEVAVAADVVNRVDIENAAGKFRERIELLRQRGVWAEPVEILPKLPTDAVPALPPPKKAAQADPQGRGRGRGRGRRARALPLPARPGHGPSRFAKSR